MYDSLEGWLERHHHFERALCALRRITPERHPARTADALAALAEPLRLHMAQEEDWLLPRYAEHVAAPPPNAARHVFEADHHRLRSLLAALETLAAPTTPDDVLTQATTLSLLAGVLEHHDQREARWLKPVLDAALSIEERRAWLDQVAAAEADLQIAPAPAPEVAPPPLLDAGTPLRRMALHVAQDSPDVEAAWRDVGVPDHPKGGRHHRACSALLERATAAPDLAKRRDGLAALSDRLRLFALLRRP